MAGCKFFQRISTGNAFGRLTFAHDAQKRAKNGKQPSAHRLRQALRAWPLPH